MCIIHAPTHNHNNEFILKFILCEKRGFRAFWGCHRQPIYCFHFDFRYITLVLYIDIYIYIICVPTRNRNNEFILECILREIKMADFER